MEVDQSDDQFEFDGNDLIRTSRTEMLGNNGTAALSLWLPGQARPGLTDILQISDLIKDSTFTKTDW